MGPWVVEELLEAGFTGPILAMHRVAPDLEGLLDENGRPVAENLTVHVKPNKLAGDLQVLTRLADVKRLGVLYFPTGDETEAVIGRIKEIGRQLGFEVRHAEGYDYEGTFAFFKAYRKLERGMDAVYVMPLWGMTPSKVTNFFRDLARNRVANLAYEGKAVVDRGAAVGNSGASPAVEARYNATKAWRILKGATPADLQVTFPVATGLAVNQANAEQVRLEIPLDLLNGAIVVNPPRPDQAEHYTLRAAIRRALTQHPDHLARIDAIAAARAAVAETRADYLPQLEAEYYIRHYDDNTVANSRDRLNATGQRLSFGLEQSLLSLETLRETDVAEDRAELTEAERVDIQHALEMAVVDAYLTLAEAEQMMAVERQISLETDLRLEAAQAVWMVDSTGLSDWLRWLDERQVAARRVATARRDVAVAEAALNTLLNRPGGLPLILDTASFSGDNFGYAFNDLKTILDNPDRHDEWVGRLVSEALSSHPEMMQSRARVSINQSRLSANRARWWPTIGFQAKLNFSDELQDSPPAFREETTWWWFGGTVRMPLFEGGRKWRARDRLKAELSASEYRRDAASLRLMRAVHQKWQNLLLTLETAYRGVRRNEISDRAWQTILNPDFPDRRKATTADLISTLHRHRQAQREMFSRRFSFFRAAAELIYSVGWSLHERRQEPVAVLQDIFAR
jgi:outer membrane protein TolC